MSTLIERPPLRYDWETPPKLFNALDAEFHFTLDVCADMHNAKLANYYSPTENGLLQAWAGTCWMNPPYGRGMIGPWIKKAYDSACSGDATVVCLIPARPGNDWWKWVIKAEVRFLRNRVKFVGAKTGAKFDCVVAIFHAHLDPSGIMKVWKP
jgi:phage N-6-adenine-methyltransferase